LEISGCDINVLVNDGMYMWIKVEMGAVTSCQKRGENRE
jgi:hypothetical protein